jgi:hypothetical protein
VCTGTHNINREIKILLTVNLDFSVATYEQTLSPGDKNDHFGYWLYCVNVSTVMQCLFY